MRCEVKDNMNKNKKIKKKFYFNKIYIEVTNICNFNCNFCVYNLMKREKGFMDLDLFKKIVTEISENGNSQIVFFHLMGEPLLHPDIIEMLNYASKKTSRQDLVTNASTLDSEKKIRDLFDTGLTNINISFYNKTEHDFIMRNANISFNSYLKIIKNIIKTKYKYGYDTDIQLYFFNRSIQSNSLLSNSIPKLEEIDAVKNNIQYWRHFLFNLKEIYGYNIDILPYVDEIRHKDMIIWHQIKLCRDFGIILKPFHQWFCSQSPHYKKAILGKCWMVLTQDELAILWNGDVVLCCLDYDGETKIGNMKDTSVQKILTSNKMKEVKRKFQLGIIPFERCKYCLGGNTYPKWIIKQILTYAGNTRPIRSIYPRLHRKFL